MSVVTCSFETISLIIGLLISIVISIIFYKFILTRIFKNPGQKWISIIVSIIIFAVIISITLVVAFYCVGGPGIGPDGRLY